MNFFSRISITEAETKSPALALCNFFPRCPVATLGDLWNLKCPKVQISIQGDIVVCATRTAGVTNIATMVDTSCRFASWLVLRILAWHEL